MTAPDDDVSAFFADYRAALLARDERAVARMYAVPGLIVFPGRSIAVGSEDQTASFFAGSWGQYDGIDDMDVRIRVLARGPAAVWADVVWSYGGQERERFCYQLVPDGPGHRIAVLTPLSLDDA